MSKIVFIPKETREGETRVAANPGSIKFIKEKLGFDVIVEKGAGILSNIFDKDYEAVGAKIVPSKKDGYSKADVVLAVNPDSDCQGLKKDAIWISSCIPQQEQDFIKKAKKDNFTLFSLNLLPRITRAQKMDILSSQANLAGYKAVLMAADKLAKIFPMMMTPAGTINPARVVVMGVGVAGLQAIATAKRLGAQVEATDVRIATKEQVESLGAKFITVEGMENLEQDANGYAVAPPQEFLDRQKEEIAKKVSQADVVITTALIPGKPAPVLVTKEMVKSMKKGSIIVDMAAAMGGNCEATKPGETIVENSVVIIGEKNIPALIPEHATEVYAKNLQNYLEELTNKQTKEIDINLENEVIKGCLVTQNGEIVNEFVKSIIK